MVTISRQWTTRKTLAFTIQLYYKLTKVRFDKVVQKVRKTIHYTTSEAERAGRTTLNK